MRSEKDVEAYLGRLGRRFETVDGQGQGGTSTTFVLRSDKTHAAVAVRVDAPLVVARVDIGEAKSNEPVKLFRLLLEANAGSLIHTSFGLEGDHIVLSAALELENLDFNELEAVLDEIDLTLAREVPKLRELTQPS